VLRRGVPQGSNVTPSERLPSSEAGMRLLSSPATMTTH
jgi:hypothetical protein